MSQYAKEIKHILATLNEQGDEHDAPLPDEEVLDTIHVYPVEGGGILLLKTPLEPEEAALPVIDSRDDQTAGVHTAKNLPPPFVLFLLLLGVFVLGDVADNQLIALMTPTVTVTIVPQTHTVTATTDLPAAAIQAHPFAPLTLSLLQTVPATGTGHQDARVATGTLTFYNGLFTPQSIAQETVFTGSDGIQVVTDASVTIPANTPPVDGQATIGAHAVLPGHSGNIAAGDITATIGNGVLVRNNSFRGGQDERTFAVVTKEDIQQAVTQLTPRLLQSEQAASTSQLQAHEALFSPGCWPTTSTDHQPGDEVTHVTVTVAETCTAGAYNQQAMQVRGEQLLNAKARTLGKEYHPVGDIRPTLLSKQATATIRVQFSGTYLYQINQQALTTLIAGQPKQHALLLLSRIRGIQHVMIVGISDDNPIPLDTTHIRIMLLYTVA